jgi:hypothetical protein
LSLKAYYGIVLSGVLLVGNAPLFAKDPSGNFTVKGVGVFDCNAYLVAAKSDGQELAQYAGYLTGYVSAYNEHVPDTFELLPWQTVETLMKLMLRRCAQRPEANFGTTVTEMAHYFQRHKLTHLSEQVQIGESPLKVYPPVLKDIEKALERRGYATGDVAASLAKFQRDENLPPSDEIDQLTFLLLLHGDPVDAGGQGQNE